MKQVTLKISAIALLAMAASCGGSGSGGQLVGTRSQLNYKAPVPVGMSYVPSGVLKMGNSDEDIRGKNDALIRTVQMTGFYMDATEITNDEYRTFTNWVRDSIAHTMLGDFVDNEDGTQNVDFRRAVNYRNADVQDQLTSLYLDPSVSGTGRREFDASKLVYHYESFDYDEAARNPTQPRMNFVRKYDISAYPDTTVWVRQFAYAYNDPIAQQYNWFPAFGEYPVVGVTWNQAVAFCDWRTKYWRSDREKNKQYFESEFRLPSESQWEWAARGGRNEAAYPWGGPYIVNKKGCYLANFKPQPGNYAADGGLYTVPANSYWPNDYGLYNMAGNVAEWTASTYFDNAYGNIADVNPDVMYRIKESDPQWMRRKVVRGGSWRDVKYFLQNGTRDWEYADTAKSYIGFRCVYQVIHPALSTNTRR